MIFFVKYLVISKKSSNFAADFGNNPESSVLKYTR